MSEPTAEIEHSVLRAMGIPGWGESNMELLEMAREDLADAQALLVKLHNKLDNDESRLARMVSERVARAKERVEICHNELDVERAAQN